MKTTPKMWRSYVHTIYNLNQSVEWWSLTRWGDVFAKNLKQMEDNIAGSF